MLLMMSTGWNSRRWKTSATVDSLSSDSSLFWMETIAQTRKPCGWQQPPIGAILFVAIPPLLIFYSVDNSSFFLCCNGSYTVTLVAAPSLVRRKACFEKTRFLMGTSDDSENSQSSVTKHPIGFRGLDPEFHCIPRTCICSSDKQ